MTDPIFWLGFSILLVAVSLTAVLAVTLPAMRELARAARSAEKLFDTLSRELPPTLEAIRLTGMEITNLTDDMSEGVQSVGRVVKQVDHNLSNVRKQTKKAQTTTRSIVVGFRAAWKAFRGASTSRRPFERLSASEREASLELDDNRPERNSSLQQSGSYFKDWEYIAQQESKVDEDVYSQLEAQGLDKE